MLLEDFGKYFNNKDIKKDDAQEHMSEMLYEKEKSVESRHVLYEEFEKLQSSIEKLDSEIDELIPQQNKSGVSMSIAQKHAELNNYQRILEDFILRYPTIAEKEPAKLDAMRKWLETKKETLASLQNVPYDITSKINKIRNN